MSDFSYAVQLAQKLIRCPSITPKEAGTLDLLARSARGGAYTAWF